MSVRPQPSSAALAHISESGPQSLRPEGSQTPGEIGDNTAVGYKSGATTMGFLRDIGVKIIGG